MQQLALVAVAAIAIVVHVVVVNTAANWQAAQRHCRPGGPGAILKYATSRNLKCKQTCKIQHAQLGNARLGDCGVSRVQPAKLQYG